MLDQDYSPNAFVVDLRAVSDNVQGVRQLIGSERKLFAALKGNAYGFGLLEIAKVVLASGADALAVVHVCDAIKLRRAGIEAPILLYGGDLGDPAAISLVERYGLIGSVVDEDSVAQYSSAVSGKIQVFMKVDVGLERLGVTPDSCSVVARRILESPRLELLGVYTHMSLGASRTESSHSVPAYLKWQFDRFLGVLSDLQRQDIQVPIAMAASSPALCLSVDMCLDAVDPGRLIFGIVPRVSMRTGLRVRPAFRSLSSRLIQTKAVKRIDFIAEAGFPVRPNMRIGVIPMGSADGFDSVTCGEVLVRECRAAVLGIFLEHARLDLTDIPDARAGDEVIVIGRQGNSEITVADVAERHDHVGPAGIASMVRESVKRVYLNSGRQGTILTASRPPV